MRSKLALSTGLAALSFLAAGCTEQVVTAVRVSSVEVSPARVNVQVGAAVQLVATLEDGDGHELRGRTITWSTSAASRATVDDGMVHGVAPGDVTITATVEGVQGQAGVVVTGVPISADPDSVGFVATAGAANPAPVKVRVSSAGADPGQVSATIAYAATDPGGWLSVSLGGSAVPVDLTASAKVAGLSAGSYRATVRVWAPAALDTIRIPVTFRVKPAPPAAPSQLSATAVSHTRIDISWRDNSSDEAEFRLERSGGVGGSAWVELAVLPANKVAYADSDVDPSTKYYYRVRACSSAGCSGYSATVSATTPAPPPPPAAPSSLGATAVSWAEIDLAWDDNSDNEAEFRLERSEGAGSTDWTQIAVPAANATSYKDVTVAASTTYYYRIRACSEHGCSAYSATASATTPAPPPPEIVLGSSAVTLSTVVGDSSSLKRVSVTNGGTGSVSGLQATITYAASGGAWLRASLPSANAPTTLDLRGSAARLLAGSYEATVAVSSTTAVNSPERLSVTLEVAPNPKPWIFLDSTQVSYSGILGGPPPGLKTVGIENGGLGTLKDLKVSVVYAPEQPKGWLVATLVRTTAPTDLLLYAVLEDESGHFLPAGSYEAAVVVSSKGAANSPQTITVRLTIQ